MIYAQPPEWINATRAMRARRIRDMSAGRPKWVMAERIKIGAR